MNVLITGITGMAGSHMADYLVKKNGCDVHGTIRWRSNRKHIAHLEKSLHLHECELKDPHAVIRLLKEIRPKKIYHFASQSNVATSWNSPRDTLVNNITAELNLFEALKFMDDPDVRVLVSGSSEEYGLVHADELPVKETNPLRPLSPYAVSKVTQDTLAYQYFKSYGLQIVRTRSFNHTGPRQADVFAASNFARQIVEIERGKQEPVIHVGNLEARRDFTDIRDVVKAYDLALETCEAGEVYNIGRDKAYSIKQVLELLLGMSRLVIEVKEDPARMRPSDVPVMLCDSTKFRDKSGWHPEIPFEKTLSDLLDYWRCENGRIFNDERLTAHGARRTVGDG
jgi:GDP-4-dehydro-6-deoxy-D-mannose reductase